MSVRSMCLWVALGGAVSFGCQGGDPEESAAKNYPGQAGVGQPVFADGSLQGSRGPSPMDQRTVERYKRMNQQDKAIAGQIGDAEFKSAHLKVDLMVYEDAKGKTILVVQEHNADTRDQDSLALWGDSGVGPGQPGVGVGPQGPGPGQPGMNPQPEGRIDVVRMIMEGQAHRMGGGGGGGGNNGGGGGGNGGTGREVRATGNP